jgi:L-threonylcarbamoyladenylate synthase
VSGETRISTSPPTPQEIDAAAELIRGGRLVVFPTETVYGLGADAGNDQACRRIFTAKERPADNPLIVHVAAVEMVKDVVREVPTLADELFRAFSPGPLSIVLPAARGSGPAPAVTAGNPTVAVRIPSHPVAQDFLRACRVPVAAPSANASGRPSPTTAAMASRDMAGRVELILDGGACIHGVESTVVAVDRAVTIYREGAVTREMIRDLLGDKVDLVDPAGRELSHAPSPGTRHAHYRPAATVVAAERDEVAPRLAELAATGRGTAILYAEAPGALPPGWTILRMPDLATYAQGLYQALVDADDRGDSVIVAELPPEEGLGRAIRDRLLRAAGA